MTTERRRRPTTPTPGGRRYLKVPAIAQRLDVSSKLVRKWIKIGTLKASRFEGEWRVAEDDFAAFEAAARFRSDSPGAPLTSL